MKRDLLLPKSSIAVPVIMVVKNAWNGFY